MTIIATETSTAATVAVPSESSLHVFTGSFVGKFMINSYLRNFQSWVVTFQPHERYVHLMETIVAVDVYLLTWKVQLIFGYLVVADTANFEPDSSQIYQMSSCHSHPTESLSSHLHHFSLHSKQHQISTFFALQFYVHLQTTFLSGIENVHYFLLTDTLQIYQHLLHNYVLTILKQQRICSYLVRIENIVNFLVLTEFDLCYERVLVFVSTDSDSLFLCLVCGWIFLSFLLQFQLFIKLFTTVKLVLQFKVTLFVQLFEVVLDKLQCVKNRLVLVIFIDELKHLLLIIFWNTQVQYDKLSSFLRIAVSLNFNIKSIFFKIEMKLHLLLEKKWPHFNCEVQLLSLERSKVICIFSQYLVVLFFDWVGQSVYYVQKLFSLEKFLFFLLYMFLHLFGSVLIWEFFVVNFGKLQHFLRFLLFFIFFFAF